jgi:LEA14-like dessication related protein
MKLEKKYIIAAGIGVVTVAGALAYLQYKKLMNYAIGFKSINIKKLQENNADFDLLLNFTNKSDVAFNIESQVYDVYINDRLVSKAVNYTQQSISSKSTSVIAVNVKFNPKKTGQNILSIALSLKPVVLKVDMKLKVKLWFFKVNIPYVYTTTLKDLLKPSSIN